MMDKDKTIWIFGLLILITGFLVYNGDLRTNNLDETKEIRIYFEPVTKDPKPDINFGFSTVYWENIEDVDFIKVESQEEADVTVRWIKEYSDNKLGFAMNGFVELGYGDSECEGTWRPYEATSMGDVFIHELGHILGKGHSTDEFNIMYPTTNRIYVMVEDDFEGYEKTHKAGGPEAYYFIDTDGREIFYLGSGMNCERLVYIKNNLIN